MSNTRISPEADRKSKPQADESKPAEAAMASAGDSQREADAD